MLPESILSAAYFRMTLLVPSNQESLIRLQPHTSAHSTLHPHRTADSLQSPDQRISRVASDRQIHNSNTTTRTTTTTKKNDQITD
ncbi:hypothetical protein VTI28DRAFT_10111 [Corynascus sepedonium]